MCGLTGKVYFNKQTVSETDILAMNEKILHRGPDGGGVYISPDKKIGLGHRRLSIIDLSPLGHQPMNYMNRYWIVFNGEIYNYQEKRDLLLKEGYTFKSKSDTEVILALYDKFGKKCLEHLRGMFSFAIYDEKERTIFCARDRVGKKPFKYYLDDNVFMFASELKAILTQKEYKKEPDYGAIHHYLTLQYCPTPLTGFKDIKKLEPAHYLFIDLRTKKIEKERYWRLDYSKKLNLSEEEWKKRIMEKLEESVRLRMIADVPLGAFLSGGIDSSAVVALMSKLSDKPVKTFSIGFGEQKFNELPYAQMIADKFKTEHTEFIIKPNAAEILPFLVKQYEEPYADPSAIPTYYVSKMTRDFVTVALNGDGGDENFAGYPWYSIQKFSLQYEKLASIHKLLGRPLAKLIYESNPNTFTERVNRFSESMLKDYQNRYWDYICFFPDQEKSKLYTKEFRNEIPLTSTNQLAANFFNQANTPDKLDQTLYTDINTFLLDDLLTKVDNATMAVALEGRSPLLDNEFMDLTAQIPSDLKLKGFNNKKYIFKKALATLLPKEILYRPKRGFQLPVDDWLRKDLKNYTQHILLSPSSKIKKLIKEESIKELLNNYYTSRINFSSRIWALIILELWLREYFD